MKLCREVNLCSTRGEPKQPWIVGLFQCPLKNLVTSCLGEQLADSLSIVLPLGSTVVFELRPDFPQPSSANE